MNRDQLDNLEKLISMVDGSYKELSVLSKKSPSDAINPFKLKIVNKIIVLCNSFLGVSNLPIEGFEEFNSDEVPSNSDAVFVLSQYAEALEKWRRPYLSKTYQGWFYTLDDDSKIQTYPPKNMK